MSDAADSSEPNLPKFQNYLNLGGVAKVLTPHVVKHWGDIANAAFDANFVTGHDGEFGIQNRFREKETLPEIVEHVISQSDLLLWSRAERTLEQLGFTPECLEYYASGGQALIFAIKGVPDVLLKVAKQTPRWQPTSFVVNPIGRLIVQPGDREGLVSKPADFTPITIAFVPLIPGSYSDKMSVGKQCNSYESVVNVHPHLQQTGLKNIKLPEGKIPFRISLEKLEDLLAFEGLSFSDVKTQNVICVPNHPELPIICDPRAVKEGYASDTTMSVLGHAKANERYNMLQKAIRKTCMDAVNARYNKAFDKKPCNVLSVLKNVEPLTEDMPDNDTLEFIVKIAKLSRKHIGIEVPAIPGSPGR